MKNTLKAAKFLKSTAKQNQYPPDTVAEVVFAGRSNAGKSSAINALCEQKALAKKSKTPGRTQLINFFAISDSQNLVDLPGYGYAKIPSGQKKQIEENIKSYLINRRSLRGMILLMDIRHPFTELDWEFFQQNLAYNIPTLILLSKADKLSRNQANQTLFKIQKQIKPYQELAEVTTFSSHSQLNINEVREQISYWLNS